MSHIITFSDKTIEETNDEIDQTDSILEKAEYEEIQKTITSNEIVTKKILNQRKFKKYNNLKHKPKPAENVNLKKTTYAELLQVNMTPSREISKADNTYHSNQPNIQEKLRSLSSANKYKR